MSTPAIPTAGLPFDPTPLTLAAHQPEAWNEFLTRHGVRILAAVATQCEAGCRVARGTYACILRPMLGDGPEPSEAPDLCREAMLRFQGVCARVRGRLSEYRGMASPEAWLEAILWEEWEAYRVARDGHQWLPPGLSELPSSAQSVFRRSCRESNRADVQRQVGLDSTQMAEAEGLIEAALERQGLRWWPWRPENGRENTPAALPASCPAPEELAAWLEGRGAALDRIRWDGHVSDCEACRQRVAWLKPRLEVVPRLTVPRWLLRTVQDHRGQAGPEPETRPRTWRERLISQPDWVAGLVVGGVVGIFILLVVLPRQEYARPVTLPDDQFLARSAAPLPSPLAAHLANARVALRRGKVEAALQELNLVLARRPDDMEARWLLASTYDRLGDQTRALKHYQAFLAMHERREQIIDDRVRRVRERLTGLASDEP
ncbi:MAG: tetratricopeptide repeat protein [Candidatus Sericytochromatia bacterium]|nr:tetratricopeptide repeat protein [Candidatus Sericytochromatia bacterium]